MQQKNPTINAKLEVLLLGVQVIMNILRTNLRMHFSKTWEHLTQYFTFTGEIGSRYAGHKEVITGIH